MPGTCFDFKEPQQVEREDKGIFCKEICSSNVTSELFKIGVNGFELTEIESY